MFKDWNLILWAFSGLVSGTEEVITKVYAEVYMNGETQSRAELGLYWMGCR